MKWLVRETPIYLLCITYGFPMFFFAHFRNRCFRNDGSECKDNEKWLKTNILSFLFKKIKYYLCVFIFRNGGSENVFSEKKLCVNRINKGLRLGDSFHIFNSS